MNKFIKLLLIIGLLFFYKNLMAFNSCLVLGGGYEYDSESNNNNYQLRVGFNSMLPIFENSGIGLDYYYIINGDKQQSSNILFSYRNYFCFNSTTRNSTDTYKPFFSISPSLLYFNHNEFMYGLEIQIGFDFLYNNWIIDPFSYLLSAISGSKQLLTIMIFGSIHFNDNKRIFDTGIKFCSGTVF